ncbi:MAG TPA: alpha/beta hydrolase [Glaciihabitans sp.]|nr:alpha/beta hydrolase [Glaciihabitans sp.]
MTSLFRRVTGVRSPIPLPRGPQPYRVLSSGQLHSHVFRTPALTSSGGAPVFVLLHGIGMSHRYFYRLAQALSQHGDVYALDLPGFGATPRPHRPLSIDAYAAVIADALDELTITSCVVIGHSMGSQFATELAVIRPDLVSHTVLIGPVVDPDRRSVLWQAAALSLDSTKETPIANTLVFTDYLRAGPRWYLAMLPVMMTYPTLERAALVTSPLLVVRGEKDPIAKSGWCHELAATNVDGQCVEIPGQAHVVQHGAPHELTDAIVGFIADTSAVR